MISSSHPTLVSWVRILEKTPNPAPILEAITRYALRSYEQHIEAVRTPGIVPAVVQCLLLRSQDAAQLDAQQVMLAVKALSISRTGQQALVAAGAHDAICSMLPHFLASTGSSNNNSSLDECYVQPAKRTNREGASADVFQVATQLLADLLLRSPATPAVGTLAHSVKAFRAMQQVMSSAQWRNWDPALQQNAAGVLARLAMEPAVEPRLLCTPSDHLQVSAVTGASASSCTCCTGNSSGEAFSDLLGSSEAAAGFFMSVWEADCIHYASSTATRLSTIGSRAGRECGDLQQQLQQHQVQPGCTAKGDGVPSAFLGRLSKELTVAALFGQVLQNAWHCPVMGVNETNALQHLQELHHAGQLLQPLKHNLDVRLIRAVPAAAAHLQDPSGQATPQQSQHQEYPAAVSEQVLALEGHVTADLIAAACQMQQQSRASGFSLVLRDLPKRVKAVGHLVNSLEQQLGLSAGANLYYTPPGTQGLKLHYDDHCVFVLQLQGCKSWTVAPPQQQHMQLPLTYQPRIPVTLPVVEGDHQQHQQHVSKQVHTKQALLKEQQQQQAIQQHILLPGDVLYIPRGWMHQAHTPNKQAAAVPTALVADALASSAAGSAVAALLAQEGDSIASVIPPEQFAAADNAGGSLHLSLGVEVEPRFSIQGYLHCLLEYVCSVSISESHRCSSNDHSFTAAGSCKTDVASTAAQHMDAAVSSGAGHGGGLSITKQVMLGKSSGSIAVADPIAAQQLATRAAGMLLHVLLWHHACQHPELRRACPLLFNSGEIRSAATAGLLQQYTRNEGSTAMNVSATAQVHQHFGNTMKQRMSEWPMCDQLREATLAVSSAEHHWIDLVVQQAFCTSYSRSSSPAHASTVTQAPSSQWDNTLAARSLLQASIGQRNTEQQAPGQRGTSSTAATRVAAAAGADEQAAGQLLLQLDAELLSALWQELQAEHQKCLVGAETESEAAVAPKMGALSAPDAVPYQLPGTPGVLGWIEAVQEPAIAATGAAASAVAQGASRHAHGAGHAQAEPRATSCSVAEACRKSSGFSACCICKDVFNSCGCMLLVLQVLAVAAEAHASQRREGHLSAQLGAAAQACSRTGLTDLKAGGMHFQHNAFCIGAVKPSDSAAPVLDAVVQLPHALRLLLQMLHCHECREHAAAGVVQMARSSLGARKAVRHANLALHTVKYGV